MNEFCKSPIIQLPEDGNYTRVIPLVIDKDDYRVREATSLFEQSHHIITEPYFFLSKLYEDNDWPELKRTEKRRYYYHYKRDYAISESHFVKFYWAQSELEELFRQEQTFSEFLSTKISTPKRSYFILNDGVGRNWHTFIFKRIDGEKGEDFFEFNGLESRLLVVKDLVKNMAIVHDTPFGDYECIVHFDLKPENLMVSMKNNMPKVHIIDWGYSQLAGTRKKLNLRGTPEYASPEKLRMIGRNTVQGDVFSLGIILYEAISNHPPNKFKRRIENIKDESVVKRFLSTILTQNFLESPSFKKGLEKLGSEKTRRLTIETIQIACAYKAKNRFRNAGEMLEPIEEIVSQIEKEPTPKKKNKLLKYPGNKTKKIVKNIS